MIRRTASRPAFDVRACYAGRDGAVIQARVYKAGGLRMSRLSDTVLGSIQSKIVAVVLGAALIAILCVGAFAWQMRKNIEDQIVRDHQTVADTYAGLVDQYLGSA